MGSGRNVYDPPASGIVPLFKRWPRTYRWSAKLRQGGGGVTIQSAWQKK